MAKCKVCHRDITRYYNDICPYCGTENPIDSNYKTKDMTQFVDPVTGAQLYKSKSKLTTCLLKLFAGCLGVHNFYLGFIKKGIINILTTLLFVGGVGSALFFLLPETVFLSGSALAYILPFLVVYIAHMGLSLGYFMNDSLKDSNGEFTH